jgi:hypothetical protein
MARMNYRIHNREQGVVLVSIGLNKQRTINF